MLRKRLKQFSLSMSTCALAAFAVAAQATSVAVIHDFAFSDGAYPMSGLIQGSDGNFYGTTEQGGTVVAGGNGYGVVFKMTSAGAVTVLHQFGGGDGANPESALLQAKDGNFYGTTNYLGGTGSGGTGAEGTVFKITPAGSLTVLHRFTGSGESYPHGASPAGTLIQGADGNLYGTTQEGGTNFTGTVFKITTSGTLTTLHSFQAIGSANKDGVHPVGGLTVGNDGNFYGVTSEGGTNDYGVFFKITPTGTFTVLHSMAATEAVDMQTSLIKGSDGNFYGAASAGGANQGPGVVFKITPQGAFTALHSFNGTDGQAANGLVLGSDGYLYGTTTDAGTSDEGTLYRVSTTGTFTSLFSLASYGIEFPLPLGAMVQIQAANGAYYGTSTEGGSYGTVFKFTP